MERVCVCGSEAETERKCVCVCPFARHREIIKERGSHSVDINNGLDNMNMILE